MFSLREERIKSYKIQQVTQAGGQRVTKARQKKELQRPERPDAEEASNLEEDRACPSLGFIEASLS
jgi:hypothetical protein